MENRRILTFVVAAAATAAALWTYCLQPRPGSSSPGVVPIQDGKAIDFSGGRPVVRDSAADRAAMAAAVKEIDAASQAVTFPAESPPKK